MLRATAAVVLGGALGLGPLTARPAGAQSMSVAPAACRPGNLLAGRQPVRWFDVAGDRRLPSDGRVAPEGAQWNSTPAVVLQSGGASLTWDLGAPLSVIAAIVQADANDVYDLEGSADGQAWQSLVEIPMVEGHGLRQRALTLGGVPVRFVRFGQGRGDGSYSLSELQLFCALPRPFPPVDLEVSAAPQATVAPGPRWNDVSSARFELGLAAAACALLGWGAWLTSRGRPRAWGRLRDGLLGAMGLAAAGVYVNFGAFHFGNFIHAHDTYHYYVGVKYFAELRYDRLYECTALADVEAGLEPRVRARKVTNLRSNDVEGTQEILAHPERCKDHFSADRWAAFRRDVDFFRRRLDIKGWENAQIDHGFNATPVWNIAGGALANLVPATERSITWLCRIDLLLIYGGAALVWWAFGWRVTAVALLVFATHFPNRFYWTGGAFLRYDWLFWMVAGVCLQKRGHPASGGAALAYSALLRIFPVFLFLGPVVALGQRYRRTHSWDRALVRVLAGAALATALLVPVSLAGSGGLDGYRRFAENTAKHAGTPLTNHMGLRTVLSWRPGNVGRFLRSNALQDPWSDWKAARLRAFHQALPLYGALALGFLLLLAAAIRRADEPWLVTALAATSIPVAAELTSYYYAFLLVVALLSARRPAAGLVLLGVTTLSGFFAWAPLPLPLTSGWADEQHVAMSACVLAGFTLILWMFARGAPTAADAGATDAAEAPRPARG